ncbi:hypothetical protein [Methylobacterium longum]|uniref:Uncharacterized protein n=1 Tax=Methylobacterium longum TaxID=767694 RepID=A0ABT8ANL2_9HYPH|nr:hypothetical protein [Methylobacterium longum]MDN3571442.1 hypothetical protein [Methylobacterium longum]GJE12580.1 hypothetical protein FOHLNKBM_3630 [Methylobacterium longum]
MASTKPDITTQPDVPVIETTPVDHGDAQGIGNVEQAPIRADLLHERAEEVAARDAALRSAGMR